MDSRVDSIIPIVAEEVCPKLILTEPYNGEDYSIVLKPRASTTDLYNIIKKLYDENMSITFHYATRPCVGKPIKLVVTMNKKALKLVGNCTCF